MAAGFRSTGIGAWKTAAKKGEKGWEDAARFLMPSEK